MPLSPVLEFKPDSFLDRKKILIFDEVLPLLSFTVDSSFTVDFAFPGPFFLETLEKLCIVFHLVWMQKGRNLEKKCRIHRVNVTQVKLQVYLSDLNE